MKFSRWASLALIGILLSTLAGCGKSDAPAGKTGTGKTEPSQTSSDSGTTAATTPSTPQPSVFPENDVRNYIPSDARAALVVQPQKIWTAKLLTTLMPAGMRAEFPSKVNRGMPFKAETVSKLVVTYSDLPAGFPAKYVDDDPSGYFTGVIQFNDSLSMSDRFKELLTTTSLNTLKGLPGNAWWISRKDTHFEQDESRNRYIYSTGDPSNGSTKYFEINRSPQKTADKKSAEKKSFAKTDSKEVTREEFLAWEKQQKDSREAHHKAMHSPNHRASETPEPFDLLFFAPNDQTLIVGLKSRVEAIAKGNGAAPVKDILKDANLAHDLILAGAKLDELKLPEFVQENLSRDPQAAAVAGFGMATASKLSQLLVQVGISPGTNLVDLQLVAKDDASAEQFEKQIADLKTLGLNKGKEAVAPFGASALGLLNELDANWKLTRTGPKLQASITHTEKLNQLALETFQPLAKAAEKSAERVKELNKVKQIALALFNFESSFRKLPPGGGKGDKRETLPVEKQVGWLVDLLPFIEQSNLYYGITKDKAWNDPANKSFGATIVPLYVSSDIPTEMVDGYAPTHFVGIGGLGENGPNEPADSKKAGAFAFNRVTKFSDFKDGTSNTMIGAQAYKNFGPWIANTNATIRPFTKKPYLGGPDGIGGSGPDGQTIILMGDGSVRTISKDTDPAIIEAMSTINGGEPANK